MFKAFRKDEGFTLVELMVVVLIIGILVAIAIPIFNNASHKAKVNTCLANIRTIDGAIAQQASTEGLELDAIDAIPGTDYLKATPKCPFGDAYVYTVTNGSVGHNHTAAE